MLTTEVIELLNDKEVKLNKIITTLAECFGAETSLQKVYNELIDYNLPIKIINGYHYKAGYKGSNIISAGQHTANLVEIKSNGKTLKLMFTINGKYLYQTIELDTSIEKSIVKVAEYANTLYNPFYNVDVAHKIIDNTGDIHASVIYSEVSKNY